MLVDKLNDFKTAIDAIKVALVAQGVAVSAYTLASAASLVEQVKTSRTMGSKSVTFKQNGTIYGVIITESESDPDKRITYTDNAKGMIPIKVDTWWNNGSGTGEVTYNGWDKTWIFEKIFPVMLKTNGTIDYRLDPNDQTKKVGGAKSDVDNLSYDGNAMINFDKFYVNFSMIGENEKIQVCDKPVSGFVPMGFIRADNSEADRVFLPMFLGHFDENNKLRSISNQEISRYKSVREGNSAAMKNNSNYSIQPFAIDQAIGAIYLILIKNSCTRASGIGRTIYNNDSTGILTNKGSIAFDPTTNCSKFLWMEDYTIFSADSRFEIGACSTKNKVYVKMKPPYTWNTTNNYTEVPLSSLESPFNVAAMKCSNNYGRYPVKSGGTDITYECCTYVSNSTDQVNPSFWGGGQCVWGRKFNVQTNQPDYHISNTLFYLPPA